MNNNNIYIIEEHFKILELLPLSEFIAFGVMLLFIGQCGFFLARNNLIRILVAHEIFMLGLICISIFLGAQYADVAAYIFAIVLLVISAVEAAILLLLHVTTTSEEFNWTKKSTKIN